MAQRAVKDPPFKFPEWLLVLLEGEGSRLASKLEGRLASFGVTEVGSEGGDVKPERITFKSSRFFGSRAVDYAFDTPVTRAVRLLVNEVAPVDRYVRLRLAAADVESVATCARELARYRHRPGAPGPVPHNPYAPIEDILEAGLVVIYARSFTGRAAAWQRVATEEEIGKPDRSIAARYGY